VVTSEWLNGLPVSERIIDVFPTPVSPSSSTLYVTSFDVLSTLGDDDINDDTRDDETRDDEVVDDDDDDIRAILSPVCLLLPVTPLP